MNTAAAVAILVSILGFFAIAAVAFLTYKANAKRHSSSSRPDIRAPPSWHEPAMAESHQSPPTSPTPSIYSSWSRRPTRHVTIRNGQMVPQSQSGSPSVRSAFSWNRPSFIQSSISLDRPSHSGLREVSSQQDQLHASRPDLEQGIVESSPELESQVSSPTAVRLARHRNLSTVPEMMQVDPGRHGSAQDLQQAILPKPQHNANIISTTPPSTYPYSEGPKQISRPAHTPGEVYELPATPTRTMSAYHDNPIPSLYHSSPSTPISPYSPTQPITPMSAATTTPSRPSTDGSMNELLRSKYNSNSSWA